MPGAVRSASLAAVLLSVLLASAAPAAAANRSRDLGPAEKRSGSSFLSPETRAMQNDDLSNPGMLWVKEGETLWGKPAGASGRSCGSCHQGAAASMKGVAARYPVFDAGIGRVVDLDQRINLCRVNRQQAPPLAYESEELLALTAYVAYQSRGLPVQVTVDGPARSSFEAGRALFNTRLGQYNLSCRQCHEERWDETLRGMPITQGQGTAYPAYRLEWQRVGSLQHRLRNCNIGVRAEPYPYGAQEYVDLELYLAWRAQGLPIETPGVRP